MVADFPLLRLPSVALDHVIRVMDPLEQLILSRAYGKLKLLVRRLTKNQVLRFEKHHYVKIGFGHGEKKSYLRVEIVENLSEDQKNGRVFRKNGKDTVYSERSDLASINIYDSVANIFAPKTVVITFPICEELPILELPGLNYFLLEFTNGTFPEYQTITTSSFKSTFNQPISSGSSSYLYFKKDESQLMARDDLWFVSVCETCSKFRTPLNGHFWNMFLSDWVQGKITMIQFKMCSSLVTSGADTFEGLNAKKVEGDEAYPKYQIERADGQKAIAYGADKVFHFNVC